MHHDPSTPRSSPPASPAEEKARLRAAARARRAGLDEAYRAHADAGIRQRLVDLVRSEGATSVGLYAAMSQEVDVDPLATAWLAAGLEVSFPRVVGAGVMAFHRVEAVPSERRGTPPIREPAADLAVVCPSLVVVPALALDRHGRRLGHGGGFYDRWLARNPDVRAIAVCRSRELLDAVPTAPHDVAVHAVVTEDGVYR